MDTSSITFDVVPNDPANPLGIEVWIDNQQFVDIASLNNTQTVVCSFNDDVEQAHQLKIVLKNKTFKHTQIDDQGNILKDSLITLSNFNLDEINIDQIMYDRAVYTHDFNGSQSLINDRFFGALGCNGTVTLNFSSPVYLWLLENM